MDPTRSRGEYIGRLVTAAAEGRTGTLEVRGSGGLRTLYMRDGRIVWAQTENGGAQNTREVEDAVARPLAWEPCTVQFDEQRTLSADVARASVSEPVSVRRALWAGVVRHVALNDVLPSVIDPAAGPVGPTLGLWSALDELGLEEPYSELAHALGPGLTIDDLLRRIPDRSGILMKLVWFLERARLLERPRAGNARPKTAARRSSPPSASVESNPSPVERPASETAALPAGKSDFSWWDGASPKNPPATPAPPTAPRPGGRDAAPSVPAPPTAEELGAVIAKNVRQRSGRDYYTFLGIPPKAPPPRVELACRRLLRRWNVYGRREDLDPRAKKSLEELMTSLQLVYRTLGNADRKAEYDRRVDRGTPPIVGQIRAAAASRVEEAAAASRGRGGGASSGGLLAAMRAMESSDWDRALGILQTLRMNNPSDPDVLAELGWCAHNRPGAVGEGPEEYLLLATTFAPDHLKATEYLARIALENQDIESARRRLTKLRGLAPHNRWARRTLRDLPPPKEP